MVVDVTVFFYQSSDIVSAVVNFSVSSNHRPPLTKINDVGCVRVFFLFQCR